MRALLEIPFMIKKAVITAAARGARLYPVADTVQKGMLPIVDRDGLTKPVMQVIAEEAISSGIEEICIICAPGDEFRYMEAFKSLLENLQATYSGTIWGDEQHRRITDLLERLHFRVQKETLGFGHAVLCARDFVGDEPFLLMLGDHLYISDDPEERCATQLLKLAAKEELSVSAVNPTPEHLIGSFGTLTGKHIPNLPGVYQVEKIIEKPSLSQAELTLATSGLRLGYYLCVFGMHVLQPGIFDILDEQFDQLRRQGKELLLTPALQLLAERGRYLAMEMKGRRYDLSATHGLMRAEIALGLAGETKSEVLATLVELMAEANRSI